MVSSGICGKNEARELSKDAHTKEGVLGGGEHEKGEENNRC